MTESHPSGPARGESGIAGLLVRVLAGGVFVIFGAGKFISHTSEVSSFRMYGLPFPDALVYLIGAVEIVGGGLLLCGLVIRLTCLSLAGNMAGAIILSGIVHGEMISLTLAPALLVAVLFLLWRGPGRWSLEPGSSTRSPDWSMLIGRRMRSARAVSDRRRMR